MKSFKLLRFFFSLRRLGVLIFIFAAYLETGDSVLWLSEGNPLLPTLSAQAEHSTLLGCVTSFKLLKG